MLMRNERLAALRTEFDEADHTLTIHWEGREAARGDLRTQEGRLAIEAFFRRFMPMNCAGRPRSCMATATVSRTSPRRWCRSSIWPRWPRSKMPSALPVNPLRFRANIYRRGWPAWREFDLLGQTLTIGKTARLKVIKRIQRCAATDVDPETGIRDLTIPRTLMDNFDHADCGVYAEVIAPGDIASGDAIAPAPQ